MNICEIDSLEERRERCDMLTTYQILNDQYPIPSDYFFKHVSEEHTVNTRSSENGDLSLQKSNYDFRRHFYSQRVVPHWNNLPINISSAPNKKEFVKMYNEKLKEDKEENKKKT